MLPLRLVPGAVSGWEEAPEGLAPSPEELSLSGECSVCPGPLQLGLPSVLFAAPESGVRLLTKPAVCLYGVPGGCLP